MKPSKILICLTLVLSMLAGASWAAEPDRDPFYTNGSTLADGPENNGIFEEVDPFSGNLKIVQTDFDLPQKGGLSLKIMRYYDSAIWGKVTSLSSVVADKFKSPLGIGWNMHMGMLLAPNSTNPIMVLPDGSQHVFYNINYGDPDYGYKKISRGLAILNLQRQVTSPQQYEVIMPDGIVYTFEFKGSYTSDGFTSIAQLVKIENPSHTAAINVYYRQTYNSNYSPFYLIESIVDSLGRNIQFIYSDNAPSYQLNSISVDSRVINYAYVNLGTPILRPYKLLTNVQPSAGNPWEYSYEYIPGGSNPGSVSNNHLGLKRITYPTGGTIDYAYKVQYFDVGVTDVQFRVIGTRTTSGRDVSGGVWTYSYESAWGNGTGQGARPNKTTVAEPNGRSEIYKYYGWDNCGDGSVWKVGLPISQEIYSGATLIETTQYEWLQGTKISGDTYQSADWDNTFHLRIADYNNVWIPFKKKKAISRGTSSYVTTYNTLDAYGNPTSVSETGDGGKVRNTALTYWNNTTKNIVLGKPSAKSTTGSFAGTASESYLYNNDGTLQKQTLNGVITDYTYYTTGGIQNGDLKTVKDANGVITSYEWSYGRISKIINQIYSINSVINPNGTIASETNGRNYTTYYLYDGLLRLTKITPPIGNVINISYPSDSSYRQEQRGLFWTKQWFDGFGRDRGITDCKGVVTSVVYKANGIKDYVLSNIGDKASFDELQRPIQFLHLDNKAVQQSYAGNMVTVTDELLRPTVLTYQSFGNPNEKFLVSIQDAKNNVTSYDYNILGGLTRITAGALIRTFNYDPLKFFLTSEINPEMSTITYGRDLVGNLTSVTDGLGTTTYVYDAINRIDYISKAGKTIDYTFDSADNRIALNAPGANLTFTYDAANRLTSKVEQLTGIAGTFAMSFAYDANDNLEFVTYPSGGIIQYVYNANNQVTSVNDVTDPADPQAYVSAASYNIAGQTVSYTLGNDLLPNHTYTNRFFPMNVIAGGAVNLTYAYYDTGNVSTITNNLDNAKSQGFNYDEINRLTNANGAWGSGTFGYDRYGNRLSKNLGGQATNYIINATTQRLDYSAGAEISEYYYNSIGQVSSATYEGTGYIYTFDTFNNLEKITSPPYTFGIYTYDGDGMRVTKASDGKTTLYHYDLSGNLLTENLTDGSVTIDYIYFNSKLLAKVEVGPPTILSPNGGEAFSSGEAREVLWGPAVFAEKYRISYSLDNKATWTAITTTTDANVNSYVWQVVDVTVAKMQCFIKIDALNSDGTIYSSKISDAPFTISPMGNPLIDNAAFVKQVYFDFLNRPPAANDLQFWVGQLDSGAQSRAMMVEQFLHNQEFSQTVAPVVRLYFACFMRIPDYDGLIFWVNEFASGNRTLDNISDFFASSTEFQTTYGSLSNAEFISRIYLNVLGREPDTDGLIYWTNELNTAARTRGQVMVAFSESAEYQNLMGNGIYVTMAYIGLLRRSPDQGGFDYWVSVLEQGMSGLILVDSVLQSDEYRQRFLP